MAGTFELYKDKAGEYRFRLKDENGHILLVGEGYKAKINATKGIESIRSNAPIDERYERKNSHNGKFMFNLKATNGQVICTSKMQDSADAVESTIESVKANAPGATIDDQT